MMDHELAQELCALRLYDELDARDREGLEQHLGACPTCAAFDADLAKGLGRLRAGPSRADLPPGWREQLEQRIEHPQPSARPVARRWLPLAASFLVGAALAWSLAGVGPREPVAEGERAGSAVAPPRVSALARATPPTPVRGAGEWGLMVGYQQR